MYVDMNNDVKLGVTGVCLQAGVTCKRLLEIAFDKNSPSPCNLTHFINFALSRTPHRP